MRVRAESFRDQSCEQLRCCRLAAATLAKLGLEYPNDADSLPTFMSWTEVVEAESGDPEAHS